VGLGLKIVSYMDSGSLHWISAPSAELQGGGITSVIYWFASWLETRRNV